MALTDNLVSYWKLDESSGNAADSVGSNTLTNTGTMTYAAAKINNGAVLANGKYLTVADASQTGLDFATGNMTWSYWINFTSLPAASATNYMISKWGDPWSYGYACLLYNNAGTYTLRFVNGGVGGQYIDKAITTPTTGVWYHYVWVFTAASAQMEIFINGSTQTAATGSNTALGNNTIAFNIGTQAGGGLLDGGMDEVGCWSRALSSTEVTTLYNGGTGLQYPFIITSATHFLSLLGVGS